ncbi:hypothetical protein Z946_497 [Sulfitobacter noctilucicola]|nr:hypothetical protein Z946_497 [Sulfitobacter noctilucicola]
MPKNHDLSTQNSLKRLIFNTLTPTEPLHDESHFTIEDALDPHQANPNPSASFREISVGCKKDTAIDWRPIPSTLSRQTIGDVSLCVSDHLGHSVNTLPRAAGGRPESGAIVASARSSQVLMPSRWRTALCIGRPPAPPIASGANTAPLPSSAAIRPGVTAASLRSPTHQFRSVASTKASRCRQLPPHPVVQDPELPSHASQMCRTTCFCPRPVCHGRPFGRGGR